MKGITLVMSTHEMEVAYSWAEDFKVVHQGRLLFSGPAEELFANRTLLELLGFQAPAVYRMNEEMARSGLLNMEPVPRNMAEMRLKFCHMNRRPVGTLHIREVDQERVPSVIEVHGLLSQGKAVGYYGSKAKHLLAITLPTDVRLPGLTGCLDKMIDGKGAVLYAEPNLVPAIKHHINNLASKHQVQIQVTVE
jgi:cobalt/nickel transport system ATP-binding protein